MLGTQQRFSSSMTSLNGANISGGPYPTAPVGPLQLPHNDPGQMPVFRSQPPSPNTQHHPPPRGPGNQPRNLSPPHSVSSRMSTRPIPNPATGFPSFTAGRNFGSETQLQNIINWQTVIARIFEDPPTFQSLLIFLLPGVPSPAVNSFIKQILNTSDHITHLQKCWALLKRNDREEMVSFGLPERVGDIRFEIYRMWLMVRLAWRIVQALKNAKEGTRIAEVGEWALYVIETNNEVSPEKFDPIPLQTLACSLTYPHPSMSLNSKSRDTVTPLQRSDRDRMALDFFEMGFPPGSNTAVFLPSTVYAKTHHARLLRRMERVPEAEEIEQSVRDWWLRSGRSMMPKARFTDLVCSEGEAPYDNVILKTLDGFFERKSENGSSTGAEEGDSSSGRDSGVDVGPVHERKLIPRPLSHGPPPPPPPPQNQQNYPPRQASHQGPPPMQNQPQNYPPRQASHQPPPQAAQQTPPPPPPKQSLASLPPLQQYTPQSQMSPSLSSSLPPLQPFTSQFQTTTTAPTPASTLVSQYPQSKPYSNMPQNGSMLSPSNSKPYSPNLAYNYNGSSDSLSSDHGKAQAKTRHSRFNFLRKDRNAS